MEKLQRFSIRKLSIGAVSCLIGTVAFLSDSHDVQAAENSQAIETAKTENEIQPEKAQESKSTEEVKGDAQNVAVDKDAVGSQKTVDNNVGGSQKTNALTAVNQTSPKDKTPLTDSAEKESKAVITTPVKQDTTTPAKQDDVANGKSDVPEQVHLKLQQKMGVATNQVLSSTENKALLASLAENKVANDTGVTTPAQQDGAANEKLIGTGKKASVSLSDGSTLTTSNDILDDQNISSILTFQSGNFKAGDTYQIKVPKKGHLRLDKVDVASLPQGMGTTTFDDSDENYWVITDNFTSTGTVKQDIKINRYYKYHKYDNGQNLKDYVRNIYHNSVQLSKNSEEKANLNIDEIDRTHRVIVMVQDHDPLLLFNNDENKIASYNVRIANEDDYQALKSTDEISIISTIKNLDWAIPDKVLVNGEESKFTYDSNNLTVYINSSGGRLDFDVDVIGRVNVSTDKFDSHHKWNTTNVVGGQIKINNIEKSDSDIIKNIIIDSAQNLTFGDMFRVYQYYGAGYYDNKYPITIGMRTYRVNGDHLNESYTNSTQAAIANSGIINIRNITGKKLDNISVDADIPDGIDLTNVVFGPNLYSNVPEKVDIKTIISYTDGSSDIFNTSELKYSNDVLNPNNTKKIKHIKLLLNNLNPGFTIHLMSPYDYDLSSVLSSVQKENTKIAEKYADGTSVAPGDLITFKETISAYGQKDTVDTGYLRLIDHNHDKYNLDLGIYPHQSNKSPNVQDAGEVGYTIGGIKPGDSPVVYIRVPKNATLTGDKPLFRTDPLIANNTPINYQLLHVGDSVFMKVQLPKNTSGSATVTVHYGTIPDGQTSEDQLAYVISGIDTDSYNHRQDYSTVFGGDYDGDIKYNNSPEINNDFNALFKQEGINLKDVVYCFYDTSYDGRTMSIDNPTWDVLTSEGISTISMTDSNMNPMPNMDSTQNVHGEHPDTFNIYGSIINATDQTIKGATQVINVPDNSDGKSQFNPVLNGPIHLIDAVTGNDLSGLAEITYSTQKSDLNDPESTISGVSADQVTDWSQIKSVQVHFRNNSLPVKTSARAVLTLKDSHIYDDIGKTIYASNKAFTKDQQTGEFELLPTVIKSGSTNSAKLTVTGQAKVHTLIHYGDQYIELPDKLKTYAELKDVMQRNDFLSSDADLTDQDRALLPANIAIDYAHPTIKNSDETYVDGYKNGLAKFGKQVKYDFNNDSVVFNAQDMKLVTDNKDVTETIHYVYKDGPKKGQKAADDVVNTVTFTKTGYQNPFTGETKWANNAETKKFKAVDSPTITNYTPDSEMIDAITVNQNSDNIVKTVSYKANCSNLHVIYQDDTDNKELSHQDFLNGFIGDSANYNTNDTISNYQNQHYDLVSDETNGQSLTYQDTDKTYVVHFKHHISNVNETSKSTQTVHYVASDNSAVPPDVKHEVSYSRTNQHDDVTGKITNYGTWGPVKTLPDVQTPEKKGYTPDYNEVKGAATTPGKSEDFKTTVTYTPDKQKAKVVFIDDTDHQTLKTVNKDGVTKGDSGYSTRQDIQNYENQHYVLVSDTSGGSELIFDDDDLTDQYYEVHLKHGSHDISDKKAITETITYKMSDDSKAPNKVEKQVEFNRVGTHDDVTNTDTWDKWQPSETQTFDTVPTPDVKGYTPDIKSVEAKTVTVGDKDITVTVTYNPDQKKAKVLFIDDTAKTTLATHNLTGVTNGHESYNPSEEINQFVNKHYVLVSSDYPDNGFTYDNDDSKDQVFEIHLKHGTHAISDKRTITETVTYRMSDSSKAPDKVEKQVEFNRDGYNDEVTKQDHWNKWQPDKQNFSAVPTPDVKGYTPDIKSVEAQTVTSGDKDITITVTYTPDQQKAKVLFIDDTAKTTLDTHNLTGATNGHESYNPSAEINQFVNKHYVFVSSDYPDNGFTYDNDDSKDQVFEIHLKHGSHAISDKKSITETITYKTSDGSKTSDKVERQVEFSRVGKHDDVTNTDTWDAWQPNKQSFDIVPTPDVKGYTPDIKSVEAKTVTSGDKDITVTVTYTPDQQKAKVLFIDDTAKTTLDTHNLTGVTNSHESYSPSEEIDQFVNKHYVFVSSNYPDNGFTYDNDDSKDQVFEVHLKHGTHKITDKQTITETVTYRTSDGSKTPNKVGQQVEFSRVGKHDDVTNTDTWDKWQPNKQSFSAVPTPDVKGYTPDIKSVEAKTVTSGDKDITETVTYTPDQQKAKVLFIDDTAKTTLDTHNLTGVTNGHESYNPSAEINQFVNKHYVLVSSDYPEKGFTYDNDDSKDQVFEVHLKHGTHAISDKKSITETITYKMSDDSKAPDKVEKQVEFSRVGKHDDVTNTDTWNAWQPNKQSFSAVPTPEVKGYTPDIKLVEAKTVTSGDKDITVTVTYNPNQQKAKVLFIDDTAKTTLDTHNLTGVTNGHESYNPSAEINQFVDKHYVFVSSDYPDDGFTYDNDDSKDQVFEVHLKHGSHAISDKRTITETITYKMSDGFKTPDKIERQVEFSRVGKHDDVTNTDTWDKWQPNKQSFNAVPTPDVKGYTPDIKSVEAKTVTSGDKDITVTVTYTPDQQKAKVLFIDDTTKKTLDTHNLTGVTNGHEKYSPFEEIEKFIHENYVFVSSDYPEKGFIYDNDDSKDQVFEIHLKERPTESDTPTIPDNTEDNGGSNDTSTGNGGSNDTSTGSDNPEKDNGGSDTVDKSSHKTSVKRNANKKHQGVKKTKTSKISKTAKLNPNKVNTKANRFTQPKLKRVQESAHTVDRKLKHDALPQPKHDTLPQTSEKQSGLMAMLGLAISGLGMIGAAKSKKRKDNQ